eukprot:749977-Hanusia_phi.AAC.4
MEAASSLLESNLSRYFSQPFVINPTELEAYRCFAIDDKLMVARIIARVWIWRTTSRVSSELRIRMAYDAVVEGERILKQVESVGDVITSIRPLKDIQWIMAIFLTEYDVLLRMVEMKLPSSITDCPQVETLIEKASSVLQENACTLKLAHLNLLRGRMRIVHKECSRGGSKNPSITSLRVQECYQVDYCKDCYAESAMNGRYDNAFSTTRAA